MSPYTIGFIIEGVLAAVLIIAILCVTVSGNGSAENRPPVPPLPVRGKEKVLPGKKAGRTTGKFRRAGRSKHRIISCRAEKRRAQPKSAPSS